MFVDIDTNNEQREYKIQLARPNKQIIGNISERFGGKLNQKFGGISELTFDVPYFINGVDGLIKNENTEKIKEKMYLKLAVRNQEEWFVVDGITDSSNEGEKTMSIEAFSIPYELKNKRITEMDFQTVNAQGFLEELLEFSSWSIGEIDVEVAETYRTIELSNTDVYGAIVDGAETFGAILVFDDDAKEISYKYIDNVSKFKGLSVRQDHVMETLERSRSTDEMVTRLYVYGSDGLDISRVNPTGQRYLEDFSYFLHPFERDENNEVIAHSYYMSDALSHAILDMNELREEYLPQIERMQGEVDGLNVQLSDAKIALSEREFDVSSVRGLLDIAKATNDKKLVETRENELHDATVARDNQIVVVERLERQLVDLNNDILILQNQINFTALTPELLDELDPFIIEKEWSDDRYVDGPELYRDALDKFEELQQPQFTIDVGLPNIEYSPEHVYYDGKIGIGDKIRVREEDIGIDYRSPIVELDTDLDEMSSTVTIASEEAMMDDMERLVSIIYDNRSASTTVSNNKYKWDSVTGMKDEITQLREGVIDATQNRITAGVNESVEISDRGMVLTNPDFPDEMIIMQAGVIALSKDGGVNWTTSVTPNGVIADTIVGKLLAGNNLIITNDSGSFVLDQEGLDIDMDSIRIRSGDNKNILDEWNGLLITMGEFADNGQLNSYEKEQIKRQWDSIVNSFISIRDYYVDFMGPEGQENRYPAEYRTFVDSYESLKEYLNDVKQSDGYPILDEDRMDITSPVDGELYRKNVDEYTVAKDDFMLRVPLDFAHTEIEQTREHISLNYTKNDEIVTQLNLSEEGVRIDGELLEINAKTEFNDDTKMNAGVITNKYETMAIDLNTGNWWFSEPIKVSYGDENPYERTLATTDDIASAIDGVEMTYTGVLTNDAAVIAANADGEVEVEGYYTASTVFKIYQQNRDVTEHWKIEYQESDGVTGDLRGNKYNVTEITTDSGQVVFTATYKRNTVSKTFNLTKVREGERGVSAELLQLHSTSPVVMFDAYGNPDPAEQDVLVEAELSVISGDVSWDIIPYIRDVAQDPIEKESSNNAVTITQEDFMGDITSIRITASLEGLSDTTTISKLMHGERGSEGKQGVKGIDSTVYKLSSDSLILVRDMHGQYTPGTITLSGTSRLGAEPAKSHDGYFVIYERMGEAVTVDVYTEMSVRNQVDDNWEYIISDEEHPLAKRYVSRTAESEVDYTTGPGVMSLHVKYYKDRELTDELDNLTVMVVSNGESAINMEVYTTNGESFLDSDIDTDMYVKVYYGSEDVTDKIPADMFYWTRTSSDVIGDLEWNSKHKSTKTISITREDVDRRAHFDCHSDTQMIKGVI